MDWLGNCKWYLFLLLYLYIHTLPIHHTFADDEIFYFTPRNILQNRCSRFHFFLPTKISETFLLPHAFHPSLVPLLPSTPSPFLHLTLPQGLSHPSHPPCTQNIHPIPSSVLHFSFVWPSFSSPFPVPCTLLSPSPHSALISLLQSPPIKPRLKLERRRGKAICIGNNSFVEEQFLTPFQLLKT